MVLCYCTVSDIGGTHMMICTYHYRLYGEGWEEDMRGV